MNAFKNPGGDEEIKPTQSKLNLNDAETIGQKIHPHRIELFAKKYYAKSMRNGLMLLDVHGALVKIRLEQLEAISQNEQKRASQKLLFALPVELSKPLIAMMHSQQNVWQSMGWEM